MHARLQGGVGGGRFAVKSQAPRVEMLWSGAPAAMRLAFGAALGQHDLLPQPLRRFHRAAGPVSWLSAVGTRLPGARLPGAMVALARLAPVHHAIEMSSAVLSVSALLCGGNSD